MQPLLDRDVIYLRPGAHATYGGDQTATALSGSTTQTPGFTAWQPIGGGLSRDALAGYTFGIAIRPAPESGSPLIERYIAFWTRTPGGRWGIAGYIEIPAVGIPSPAGSKSTVAFESTGAVRAMFGADSAYAEVASVRGPATAAREMMSEEGILLTTTQLVVGPRAASDYFEAQRSLSLSWVPRDARIAGSGDLGFTIGDALATSAGPTGIVMQRFTKYLTVWRRERDGRWRALVTGANDRPSPIGD